MARRLLLIMLAALCLARPVPLGAQAQVLGCDGEPYHHLDFWVGSWNVRLADGTQAGTNVIEKALKGCALFEHWRDVRGNEGKRLFYYQRVRQAWKQVWVSTTARSRRSRWWPHPRNRFDSRVSFR